MKPRLPLEGGKRTALIGWGGGRTDACGRYFKVQTYGGFLLAPPFVNERLFLLSKIPLKLNRTYKGPPTLYAAVMSSTFKVKEIDGPIRVYFSKLDNFKDSFYVLYIQFKK